MRRLEREGEEAAIRVALFVKKAEGRRRNRQRERRGNRDARESDMNRGNCVLSHPRTARVGPFG